MFIHTLKTTVLVLLRRKFFTFISLFCIALTLMVLIVVGALIDNVINPAGAERDFDKVLMVNRLSLTNAEGTSNWLGALGYEFIADYILPLKTPKNIAYYNSSNGQELINGVINRFELKYTNANYANIVKLSYIDGQYFDQQMQDEGQHVVIITERVAEIYFGNKQAVGEDLSFSDQRFKVIAVVKNEPGISDTAKTDIWAPVTSQATSNYKENIMGNYSVLLQASSRAELELIRQEYQQALSTFVYTKDPEAYSIATSFANTKLEALARDFTNRTNKKDSGLLQFVLLIGFGSFLFMALPAINLFNLNISRIMERASEIGVRKAFGASRSKLISQFLIENILLTFVGGVLGVGLSVIALNLIQISGIIPFSELTISWWLVAYMLAITLVFALFSGSYPAWRMARLDPVKALKGY